MKEIAFFVAAALAVLISLAHSYLGERYILIRLFRRGDLPKLFGDDSFTIRTLRFAWHLTSVAWIGLATILVQLALDAATPRALGLTVGVTFLIHALVTAIASRGRHLAWVVFLVIASLSIGASTLQ